MAPVPRPSVRGFTLVELLIAMGLSLLIVGGMWIALQSQEGAYRAQGAGREARQMLEAAVQQLQEDLKLAGTGLPPQTLPAIAHRSARRCSSRTKHSIRRSGRRGARALRFG